MVCYKAIERYYNEKGLQIENLCGYGYSNSLEEAKKQYKKNILVTEITEKELIDFQTLQKQTQTEDL